MSARPSREMPRRRAVETEARLDAEGRVEVERQGSRRHREREPGERRDAVPERRPAEAREPRIERREAAAERDREQQQRVPDELEPREPQARGRVVGGARVVSGGDGRGEGRRHLVAVAAERGELARREPPADRDHGAECEQEGEGEGLHPGSRARRHSSLC